MRLVVSFSLSTCMLTYNSLLAEGERKTEREREREMLATDGMDAIPSQLANIGVVILSQPQSYFDE